MDLGAALAEQGIYIKGEGAGEHYLTCPQCSHTRRKKAARCLSVKIDGDGGAVWHCSHCDWRGNVPGQRRDGQPYRPPAETVKRVIKPGRKPPAAPARPEAMFKWFEGRGVSRETVEALGIYWTKAWFPQHEAERPAIAFPYRVHGEVVNNKYRDKSKTFAQDPKARRTLYNVDSLIDNDTAIFCEGEMDVAACLEVGYPSVVSLPDGAPPVPESNEAAARALEIKPDERRYDALKECAEEIAPIKKWILATDSDGPGNLLAHQLAHRLGVHQCWRVEWPEGSKDANDTLIAHGPEMLRQCIDRARGYPVEGLVEVKPGMLRAFRDAPKREMFSVNVPEVDRVLRFRPRQVVVVSGYAADGKSSVVDWLAVLLSQRYGWRWAVFSPEHEMEDHVSKLAELYLGIPFINYGGSLFGKAMTDEQIDLAENWVSRHFFFIVDDDEEKLLSPDFILEKSRVAWLRHGIKGQIIDPYNEVHHDMGPLREDQYIANFMRRLKRFGRHHDLMTFLVVHPRGVPRDRKTGERPVPSLSDIAGGPMFWNKTDAGLIVHRPSFERNDVNIFIQKIKRKDQGQAGVAELTWNKDTGRYEPR